jgi:N-acetylglucosamine-6-phosphate deacetylase
VILDRLLVVDPLDGEYAADVEIEGGKFKGIHPRPEKPRAILMPGFIDIHTHGAVGVDFLESTDWKKVEDFFLSQGVTTFFPTSVSTSLERMIDFLKTAEKYEKYAHLEGPYISPEKSGAQNPEFIRKPSQDEIDALLRYQSFKTITLAPEVTDEGIIEKLESSGVRVSLGHSNATYEETMKGYKSGARRITHFPNALRPLHHREIGIFGAGLLHDFYLELITDGIHVSTKMVEMIYKFKGCDRIILITDSISATGLEDGEYELGGLKVFVKGGVARLENETLAGSTLAFSKGLKNFKDFTGANLKCLARVSSYNAAVHMGLEGKGRIKEGYDADVVLLDFDLNVLEVYKFGERKFPV